MALRLVLAEDNLLVREGLEQLLTGSDGLEVVAECADLDSLREAIAGQRPDVVVTDIRMSFGSITDPPSGAAALVRKQDFRPALLRKLWADHGDKRSDT